MDDSKTKADDGDNKCDKNDEDPFQTCNVIKRLIRALHYYSSLNMVDEKDDQDKDDFNKFIHDVYQTFLDDYTHLINIHSHKLENINKSLLSSNIFKICDIKNCVFTG
eukprot:383952_1